MISVFLGKGDGTFQQPITLQLNITPGPLITADVTGDGIPDLIVAGANRQFLGTVAVLKGNGDGTFQAAQTQPLSGFPTALVAGDFNHDGKLDVAFEESTTGPQGFTDPVSLFALPGPEIEILTGDGHGTLTSTAIIPLVGGTGLRLVSADFNGDGYADLALNQISSGNVLVLLNKRDGTFASPATYATVSGFTLNGVEFLTTDINDDGKPDLVMTSGQNNKVVLFIGNGDGTFQSALFVAQHDSGGLAVADFNRDGIPDIAVATAGSFALALSGNVPAQPPPDEVVILQGAGGASFPSPSTQVGTANFTPFILETADFNGDGLPDLVADNVFAGSFTVYLNKSAPPSAVAIVSAAANIANLAPDSLAAAYGGGFASTVVSSGTPVLQTALGGVSLAVQDSAGVVRLAPLVFVSPQQIDFLIPAGTTPGTATVTISGSPVISPATAVNIASVAPAIFTANSSGKGAPAALAIRLDNSTGAQLSIPVFTCAGAGQCIPAPILLDASSTVYLSLYGTGIRGAKEVTVTVNGIDVPVQFAGAQGQYAGLDQVNLTLTSAVTVHGDVPVVITADGVQSNVVTLTLR